MNKKTTEEKYLSGKMFSVTYVIWAAVTGTGQAAATQTHQHVGSPASGDINGGGHSGTEGVS